VEDIWWKVLDLSHFFSAAALMVNLVDYHHLDLHHHHLMDVHVPEL
jgi:hypothetical protein